jgi:xanthine dehydrogenase YagR molybdenum-binding subunit
MSQPEQFDELILGSGQGGKLLAWHQVPTNADIPELDVLFVGEFDAAASPLGAKGLGELTAVSVAPAIADAVYHATGRRVRDLPITTEKLL